MNIRFILKRLFHQRQITGVLLISVVLVSNVAVLGPYYQRYVNEVLLRHLLENDEAANQIIIESPKLIGIYTVGEIRPADEFIAEKLKPIFVSHHQYVYSDIASLSAYVPPNNTYTSSTEEPLTYDVQIFSFDDFVQNKIRMVDGTYPEYNRAFVGVAISRQVANETGLNIGDTYCLRNQAGNILIGTLECVVEDGTELEMGLNAPLIITGIFEQVNPNETFWDGKRMLTGGWYYPDFGSPQYQWGMIIPSRTYNFYVNPHAQRNTYGQLVYIDKDKVTANNALAIQRNINLLEQYTYTQVNGNALRFNAPLVSMITDQQNQIGRNEGLLIFLSLVLQALMLYNLLATGQLVTQTQQSEWGVFQSRGMGFWQALWLQFMPLFLIVGISAGISVLTSRLLLYGFARFITQDTRGFNNVQIPQLSLYLLGISMVASIIILLIPSLRATRLNILVQQQQLTRPTQPLWSKLFADMALLCMGTVFLYRFYILGGGAVDDFLHPAEISHHLSQTITTSQLLEDPLSILGLLMLLIGLALLWMRIFPFMMKIFARLTAYRFNGLNLPFAMWNVERGMGRYGQFVIIVFLTLTVGVVSVTINHSRKVGSWEIARTENGADLRVSLNTPSQIPDWQTMNGISNTSEIVRLQAEPRAANYTQPVPILAIDPSSLPKVRPDLQNTVKVLISTEKDFRAGIELPRETTSLGVSVNSEVHPDTPQVILIAHLIDAGGQLIEVRLHENGVYTTTPDTWLFFEQNVAGRGTPPYRIMGVTVKTETNAYVFEHSIRLKDWVAITEDETQIPLSVMDNWEYVEDDVQVNSTFQTVLEKADLEFTQIAHDHDRIETQLNYTIRRQSGVRFYPEINVNPRAPLSIPVLVSPEFAHTFRGDGVRAARSNTPDLTINDKREIRLVINGEEFTLPIEVVGIVDSFPTLQANAVFMVIPQNELGNLAPELVTTNEVWVDIHGEEPPPQLRSSLPATTTATWDRYQALLRQPLANTISAMFLAGYWLSLLLSLINFSFYTHTSAKERAVSFGILRALGWNIRHTWVIIGLEQSLILIPAIGLGIGMGLGLTFLLIPFMGMPGVVNMHVPTPQVVAVAGILTLCFFGLQIIFIRRLNRISISQTLRLNQE